jgi:hypothetical protein
VHTKNDKNNYPNALHALFPFLNSGSALKQSYLIALKISLDLQQYDLAIKLADACVDQYPHDPDVYFERFEAIIARNMLNWIQYIHANTMDQFLQDGKVKEITKENYKEFEAMLFSNLHTQLRMQEIEAIAKEFPDDYKITMKVISYKIMIMYWTKFLLFTMRVTENMEEDEILEMMFNSEATTLFDFEPYFNSALRVRPKKDVHIFGAMLIYYLYQSDF